MSTLFLSLFLEDSFVVAVMSDGLMMDNVKKVLLAAWKVNARKFVQNASEFIWNERKCKIMQNQ